jgi:hypothetical protein
MSHYLRPVLALVAIVLLAAGCASAKSAASHASANPTIHRDTAQVEAKLTKAINNCLPQLSSSAKPAATGLASLEQPGAINGLIHHSSRKAFEGCMESHGVVPSKSCILSKALSMASQATSREGRDKIAQAIFAACLLPAVQS